MRTLYMRIVLTTALVMVVSGTTAFLLSNAYYHHFLKEKNDAKNMAIAESIADYYGQAPQTDVETYLQHVAELSYQLYIVDEHGNDAFFGAPFRERQLDSEVVQSVLAGNVYHGMAEFPRQTFVTGFFANELSNSVGVPFEADGQRLALFMRPDVKRQFDEMHYLEAILLALAIGLSILLMVISTRYIVKPIQTLTEATKKIADGRYELKLNVRRRDEIGGLAHHFSQMAKSLAHLEDMRQEFVSNVSHEIQSPLTSIQGFSQALRDETLTKEQRDHYLAIIEEESRRMSLLSKQLLTLAFLDRTDDGLDKTSFDVAGQIKQIVAATEWQWREKNLAIDMDLAAIEVVGDHKLLHQVWTNLLTNSIKFSREGGNVWIKIKRSSNEDMLVEIGDTGTGIAEEDIPYIFDRFYKADKVRNRQSASSGLGLAITKKIVELHGGTIQVESEPGQGTTFLVRLPFGHNGGPAAP